MYTTLKPVLEQELAAIQEAGLYKKERIITSPQGAEINTNEDGRGAELLRQQLPGPLFAPRR